MSAVLFVREDLLKASHYKTITVPGHVHGGQWVNPYQKKVLVSDDHNDLNVAGGFGSFYQKQAHKKLSSQLDHFHTIPPEDKAAIILSHATDLQDAASASAAVSGFKASMLAGKVPTPAQYLAMQNAPASVQSKVADACAAAIGDEKYEQLLMAASAKANQPKGKPDVTSPAQAVKTSPQGQTQGAPAPEPAKPAAPAKPATAEAAVADDTITVAAMSGKTGPTSFKPAPDFKDYAEVQAWMAARAKALGMSKSDFQSSYEFHHAYPKVKAAYAVVKQQFDDKKAETGAALVADMNAAGVKLGDTVAWTMTGAFLSANHYEGKVVMHSGVPHVKLAHEVAVTKPGGKIGYTKFLQWAPYMKVKGAPVAPAVVKPATQDIAGGKGKLVPVGQTVAFHHTSKAAADSIVAGQFKDSTNSMYGKAVYLTDTKDGFDSSDALITVTLAPHKQVQIDNDTDAAAVYEAISGVDKNGLMFDSEFSKKMTDAGVGSALINVDDQKYTVVFDKSLIVGKSASSKSGPKAPPVAAAPTGPKDGDTKPGADGSNLVFKKGRWHKYVDADESGELPPVLVPVKDDTAKHQAAVAAMEGGAFYQKEAIKKLKAEHGPAWAVMHPTKQLDLAHAKYQALQGAASAAAAVSGWKKHMLAGQVPTPSEVKAMAALNMTDRDKAGKLMGDVANAIGYDKMTSLVAQAHAKAAKAPAAASAPAAPVAPAKVFVTTPPVSAPVSLAGKPAYDHLGQTLSKHSGQTLPAQNAFLKMAAQDWLAANPTGEQEMHEALASLGKTHLTSAIGMLTQPVVAPVNTAKDKFKTNPDVLSFITMFKMHGGKAAQKLSMDDLLDPPEIAAFEKLTPDEKSDVAAAISFYGPHKLNLFMQWVSEQNAKAYAQATAPAKVTSQVFKNTTPGHNKFWSVSTHGNVMKTTYGKIGTMGSTTTKEFASPGAASSAAAKLISEKKAKGYGFDSAGVHEYEPQAGVPAAPLAVGKVAGVPPAVKAEFDKLVAQGDFRTLKEILATGGIKAEVKAYLEKVIASKPGVQGWILDPNDQAMSGAATLTIDTKDGQTLYVAHDGDGYQVGVIGQDAESGSHEDFDHPEDAAAELASLAGHHGITVPAPTVEEVKQLNLAAGPKDGDTKLGADGGTLVFKNGRWHKQGIVVPDFSEDASMWNGIYAKAAAELKAAFESGGTAAVKKLVTVHKVGNKAGKFSANLGGGKFTVGPKDTIPRRAKMYAFIKAMLDANVKAGKKVAFTTAAPGAVPKPAAAPAASPKTAKPTVSMPTVKIVAGKPPVSVIDGWTQTGPQKGSNPGGKFKDKNGQEWYCKFPADVDVAMNELLAAKFYQMLGVAVPNLKLVEQGGKIGIASKWVDGISKGTSDQLAKAPGAHQAFALDAWLANWDVVGLSNDNLMLDKGGAAVRVDVGGSLVYRAQGGAKGADFGDTVPELESLLDASKNGKSAAVFGKIKKGDMAWGLTQLNKMKPSQIEELCQKAGPGSDADKAALAKKLIARRAFILAKMGVRDQWAHVKALDPTKLPVNPKDLPKPIDFANLNGPGKGLSSKAHVNAQNTLDSANMIAFAAKGNLAALKNYQYDAVDKESGAALGKKSIIDHPSSQIKNQWAGLIETLQSISTPPLDTLKMPSLGAAGSVAEISDLAGTFAPTDRVETVSAEHRMGFFMAVNQVDDVHSLVSRYKWSHLTTASKFVKDAKAGFGKLSSSVRAYVSAVQASGWINHVWSQGKPTVDASGNGGSYSGGVQTLSSKIYADALEIPEGTTLTRGMSDTTAGKSMTKQLLAATPGLVIQNTDSMCTSYKEGWSGFNGGIMLTIRCGEGCKGTPSFASGHFGSEHEITTLPGQRFVVLSSEQKGGTAHVELLMLPPHEGYVEQLKNLEALGKAIVVFFKRMM